MGGLDVFLIPQGPGAYDLYCEPPAPPIEHAAARASIAGRVRAWFRRTVAEGEAALQRDPRAPAERGRLRRFVATRLAQAVAEQRLLWHLRGQTAAVLVHPDDLAAGEAMAAMRGLLARDRARHLRWCAIDTAIGLVTIPIALLPGPNLIGYYFAFRAIGHFLSMRGARRGLSGIDWTCRGMRREDLKRMKDMSYTRHL